MLSKNGVKTLYLKRLEIQGFKSFPRRINIDFSKGITAIVGPNGSGKSNISDAIRWVLGEQSAKSLRGNKMQDIIFSGTNLRKQMGFAEVSLTIDNSDGLIPLDYSEITVTRRVFRSGESEFQINKVSCRLKDIHELFFDTGVGKDGYSIISQGKIDEVLNARPEERRAIFEEASGIMKYRIKKEETERKLELTRVNLVRINDIIEELEIQLEPLHEQCQIAQRFLSVRDKLKNIEIALFVENIDKLKSKLKEIDELINVAEETFQNEKNKKNEIMSNTDVTENKIKEQRQRLETIRDKVAALNVEIEKYNSDIKICQQKIDNINENNLRLDLEIADYEKQLVILGEENQQALNKLDSYNSEAEKLKVSLAENIELVEQQDLLISGSESKVEDLNSNIFKKMESMSELRDRATALETVIKNLAQRKLAVNEEIKLLSQYDDQTIKTIEGVQTETLNISNDIEKVSAEVSMAQEDLKKQQLKNQALNNELQTKQADLQRNLSRYELLVEMEKNFEGYSKSVKQILVACSKFEHLGRGVHGTLAALISTNKEFEIAIEVALGGALQNVVTETEHEAKKLIEHLKSNALGRVTFLPISSVKPNQRAFSDEIAKLPGFIFIASEVVECDEKYKNIVESLLGRVILVKDLDSGINIARKTGYKYKIVTLDGELLNNTGAITGGSLKATEHSIFSRRRQINEIEIAIDNNKNSINKIKSDIAQSTQAIEHSSFKISEFNERIRQQEILKVKFESELKQLTNGLSEARTKLDLYEIEVTQLSHQEEETKAERSGILKNISEYEQQIAEMREHVNAEMEKTKSERQNKEVLATGLTDIKLAINTLNENIKAINDTLEKNHAQISGLKESIALKMQDKKQNLENIDNINSTIKEFEAKVKDSNLLSETFLDEQKQIESAIADDENIIESTGQKLKLIDERLDSLQQERARLDVRKAKIELEIESVQNRIWEDYEVTYSIAVKHRQDIGNINKASKEVNMLKEEIKKLGNVNVNAIEDYRKTKERYEFLTLQRDDLIQSEVKLKKVISEVLNVMKKQFADRFGLINDSFNMVFRQLFNGGHAELRISDGDNILESGIEIEVQPPGKKLQNMMLLSGGERALTAIALLFGILRLKPAPFCLLDEIESNLDETNVYRFGRYLFEYTKQNQFIIITHKKATMEVADALYGVTMQEQGVSTVLSIDINKSLDYAN